MLAQVKRICIRMLFGAEILIFIGIYIFGAYGIKTLSHLKQETAFVEQEVANVQQEVDALQREIIAWNTHPFYKEKIAREQLQMAREGDTIFYLT